MRIAMGFGEGSSLAQYKDALIVNWITKMAHTSPFSIRKTAMPVGKKPVRKALPGRPLSSSSTAAKSRSSPLPPAKSAATI
jgi:hypothetical protein